MDPRSPWIPWWGSDAWTHGGDRGAETATDLLHWRDERGATALQVLRLRDAGHSRPDSLEGLQIAFRVVPSTHSVQDGFAAALQREMEVAAEPCGLLLGQQFVADVLGLDRGVANPRQRRLAKQATEQHCGGRSIGAVVA